MLFAPDLRRVNYYKRYWNAVIGLSSFIVKLEHSLGKIFECVNLLQGKLEHFPKNKSRHPVMMSSYKLNEMKIQIFKLQTKITQLKIMSKVHLTSPWKVYIRFNFEFNDDHAIRNF